MANHVVIFPDKVQDAFIEASMIHMPPLADAIYATAVAGAPEKTGRLKASHQPPEFTWGHNPSFTIRNTAPYAAPVHEGASPHRIVARRAPYLEFFWEKRGVIFRGRKVNHPGNHGQPWLRAAMNAVVGGG